MSKIYTVHSGKKVEVRDYSYQYLGYYLIDLNGIESVFNDFKKAVEFCEGAGLDPNKDIQTDSPEVFERCKKLALGKLNELTITKDVLTAMFYAAIDESNRLDAEIKKYETVLNEKRDLVAHCECEVLRENRLRQTGVVHGIHDAIKAVDVQMEPYWKIVYCVNTWRKR